MLGYCRADKLARRGTIKQIFPFNELVDKSLLPTDGYLLAGRIEIESH